MTADAMSASHDPVLVNLTPHPVRVLTGTGGPGHVLRAAGPPARLVERAEPAGRLRLADDLVVPLVTLTHGGVENLPAPRPGVYYVVSRLVADACPERDDLLVPHDLVRDEEGNAVACRGFALDAAVSGPSDPRPPGQGRGEGA